MCTHQNYYILNELVKWVDKVPAVWFSNVFIWIFCVVLPPTLHTVFASGTHSAAVPALELRTFDLNHGMT